MVECGVVDGPDVLRSVRRCLEPVMVRGAVRIVLGCTHFPLLDQTIQEAVAGRAQIIDPGPAVAKQALRVASELAVGQGSGRIAVELTGTDTGFDVVADLVGLANPQVAVISALT